MVTYFHDKAYVNKIYKKWYALMTDSQREIFATMMFLPTS